MYSAEWRWQHMAIFLGIGIAVLASWLLPVTRSLWDAADQWVFFTLNGSLAGGGDWAKFWALMNVRAADLIPLSFLLPMLLYPGLVFGKHEIIPACIGMFLFLIVLLLVRFGLEETAEHMGWTGDSPSLRYTPSERLSFMFPDINVKDKSGESFPGDHASVLMVVSAFYLLRRINVWSLLSAVIALVFALPRLVAGAHSCSDDFVGGTFIAAWTIAFGYYTPLLASTVPRIQRCCVDPLMQFLFWKRGWLLGWK